jgi:flagellar basal body-associated protein FliL
VTATTKGGCVGILWIILIIVLVLLLLGFFSRGRW